MAGRATNLALLALLPSAAVTGGATFLVGSRIVGLVVVVHGIVGLMVLVLVPWKSTIVRRGLRRRRSDQLMSLILAATVLLAVTTGVAHSSGVLIRAAGLTALQVHVATALAASVPLMAHVRRRRVRIRRTDVSRRTLLRAGLLIAAASAGYAALEGLAAALALPGANRRATGSYERSSGNPDGMPTTSWLFDQVPVIDPVAWRLAVRSGGTGRDWTVEEIRVVGDRASVILDCTGGWWSRQVWSGARVSRLLPAGSSGSVEVSSATGYRRRLPLTDDLLLAVEVGGRPLSAGHGAPIRLVVPGRRGYHWVKWVTRIEHDDSPWWLESPLPLQ
jgi:DMSO/TMAO reductase YedYZ molybdopterin-dependent catalytic subunit